MSCCAACAAHTPQIGRPNARSPLYCASKEPSRRAQALHLKLCTQQGTVWFLLTDLIMPLVSGVLLLLLRLTAQLEMRQLHRSSRAQQPAQLRSQGPLAPLTLQQQLLQRQKRLLLLKQLLQ